MLLLEGAELRKHDVPSIDFCSTKTNMRKCSCLPLHAPIIPMHRSFSTPLRKLQSECGLNFAMTSSSGRASVGTIISPSLSLSPARVDPDQVAIYPYPLIIY